MDGMGKGNERDIEREMGVAEIYNERERRQRTAQDSVRVCMCACDLCGFVWF